MGREERSPQFFGYKKSIRNKKIALDPLRRFYFSLEKMKNCQIKSEKFTISFLDLFKNL